MNRNISSRTDLRDAGQVLFGERIRRRISLTRASTDTRIRASLIEAIEEGEVSAFPAPVFARGLIQSYAHYLGIDPRSYLTAYASLVPRDTKSSNPMINHRPANRYGVLGSVFVPLAVVVALALLGGYLYQQYHAFVSGTVPARAPPSGSSILITTPLPSPPAVVPTSAVTSPIATRLPVLAAIVTATQPAVLPTSTPTSVPVATTISGVHIDAVAVARVWVQVEVDGKVSFVGVLNQGDRKSWDGTQKVMIWSGNASSLNVTFNGKPAGSLGAPGEVVKVTWTATS